MKVKHCNVVGKQIAYLDKGEGTPVVLVHCSSACYREWLPLMHGLRRGYRILAPDLWGYGKSQVYSLEETFDSEVDTQIASEMLLKSDAPVHLIGHSYGGAVAIEAARKNPDKIKSLTLIEPSSYHVLQHSPSSAAEWKDITRVAENLLEAVDAGDFRAGLDVYMSFYMGHLEWQRTDEKMKENLLATVEKVAGEFSTLHTRTMKLDDYRDLPFPVTFVQGQKTRNVAKRVIELINGVVGNGRVIEIPGAGHMSPMTHPREVVDILLSIVRPEVESEPMQLAG